MLLVDSVFINNSGGKVLLNYLVEKIESSHIDVHYLFDHRCSSSFTHIRSDRKTFVQGDIVTRHKFYKSNRYNFTKAFCFGNIPPTIKLKIPVYTYFHNVSLLAQPSVYSRKEKLLKNFKGLVIKYLSKNTDHFVVQTQEVKNLLDHKLGLSQAKCLVLPFFDIKKVYNDEKQDAFVFISNGNTHKNHANLLAAWNELAKKNIFPELHLTVTDNYKGLILQINQMKQQGLKVTNHGYTDPYELYKRSKYLIYPSLCESFGLGLVEAVESGCDVIASDLPFVYEVVNPTATFDPLSSASIAYAVENVLKGTNIKKTELTVKNGIQELLDLIRP